MSYNKCRDVARAAGFIDEAKEKEADRLAMAMGIKPSDAEISRRLLRDIAKEKSA